MEMENYEFPAIEKKWQDYWQQHQLFRVEKDDTKPKFYCLVMLPYPSGKIHMGHIRNYSIGDVVTRYKRMCGFQVLHPMGWDSFGLPAENAAIERDIHPATWTSDNIEYMRTQLQTLGFAYDWSREVATYLPEYYRWNQWFFLKLYQRGLAYRKQRQVNWCPSCKTVLANEQVRDDRCERCDSLVEWREMKQWFIRITEYAGELFDEIAKLDGWEDRVRDMQRYWIGKSHGTYVDFEFVGIDRKLPIFTTRIDTIYGVTFMIMAPNHPLLDDIPLDPEIREKIREFANQTQLERSRTRGEPEEKVGIDTGVQAINPFNREKIPVFVSNFVLPDYGTGAIMAVPAHDQRDFEFASKYNLPVKVVIRPASDELLPDHPAMAFVEDGVNVNSGPFDGIPNREAMEKMAAYGEERGFVTRGVDYRIKDWGVSRQRYWGTPIPMIYCDVCGIVPVPEEDLPVVLAEDVEFTGRGDSPLRTSPTFFTTTCPKCGGSAHRETDTMDTYVDSSWYMFRYTDPENDKAPFDRYRADYWFPIDLYIGGIEHATGHLIYCRFWTRFMNDLGLIGIREPALRLLTQGMVCKETYVCREHGYLYPEEVEVKEGEVICRREGCGRAVEVGPVVKMSKSRNNVISPDAIIARYGTDTARLFLLFAAPPEKDIEWSDQGVEGCFRFINRLWRLVVKDADIVRRGLPQGYSFPRKVPDEVRDLRRRTHTTIARVGDDIDKRLHLNTAIARIMEFLNHLYRFSISAQDNEQSAIYEAAYAEAIRALLLILAPFTPHLAEELWERTGQPVPILNQDWPQFEEELTREDEINVPVQINGKLRSVLRVAADIGEESLRREALEDEKIARWTEGKQVVKLIVVKKRLVNVIVR